MQRLTQDLFNIMYSKYWFGLGYHRAVSLACHRSDLLDSDCGLCDSHTMYRVKFRYCHHRESVGSLEIRLQCFNSKLNNSIYCLFPYKSRRWSLIKWTPVQKNLKKLVWPDKRGVFKFSILQMVVLLTTPMGFFRGFTFFHFCMQHLDNYLCICTSYKFYVSSL